LTEVPDGAYRITPYDPKFEKQLKIGKKFMEQYCNTLRAPAK